MKLLLFWSLFLITFCVLFMGVEFWLYKKQQKEKDRIFYVGKKTYGKKNYERYLFFSRWILTRHYIKRLKKRMDAYFPGEEKRAAVKALWIFRTSIGCGFFALLLIAVIRPNWVISVILLSGVYFANSGFLLHVIEKETMQMMEEFILFLSDIRHAYQRNPILEDCIEQARDAREYGSIKMHMSYLLEILDEEESAERIKEYMDTVPSPFLKEFFMLCVTIQRFGDPLSEGSSLFLSSIQRLKQSVNTEVLRRKKQRHLFGGYAFIIAAPLFTLPFISMWALHTMPVLTKFYHGSFGVLYPVLSFVVTFLCYQCNLYMQEDLLFWEKEYVISYYLSENPFLYRKLRRLIHRRERTYLQVKKLMSVVGDTRTVYQLFLQRLGLFIFFFLLSNAILITLPGTFFWFYLLISLLIATAAYFYPLGMLVFQQYVMKNGMLDEVMQFQSVICILSVIPRMTSEILLDWLLKFSYIFKIPIAKYLEGEEIVENSFPPFQRMMENFKSCDKVGMKKAFDELLAERNYFQEERKQEGEIGLDNKAAIGSFLSMLPTFTIVIGYLFIPFIIESFTQLFTQFEQIKHLF